MISIKGRKLSRRFIFRVMIAVYCVVIAISVAFVMLKMYDPYQNSLEALSSVCLDIVCITILIILAASVVFDNYGLYRTTRLFSGMILASIWAMFLDFLNWAFDGSLEFGHLTYWFTVGSLCMGAILACLFSLYLYCYMAEIHGLSRMRKSAKVCCVLNLFSFALTFVLAITGTAFQFVDGHYEIGALYDVVTVIPIVTLFYLVGYVIRYSKKVGRHDVFAATGYIVFMVAGAIIEAIYGVGTTYVAVAIADIFIFVMLQNEIISREKKNVQKWMNKSNTDELTGLYNRHAYEAAMQSLEVDDLPPDIVYISADVNSLKKVNDSLGHNAGDELLIGAAECLKMCFEPYGKVYRIGGDEFVAIIYIEYSQIDKIKNNLATTTQKWKGELVDLLTISAGYVTKKDIDSASIRQMAVIADQRMYEEKRNYHKQNG